MASKRSKTAPKKRNTDSRLFGVIDIGSNSVRLVVYQGLRRTPQILFNEKVLCGLGRAVGQSGRMDDVSIDRAMATLRRFAILCEDMRLDHIETVATAAVRDAENGPEFVEAVARECGFEVRVLSGKKEARLSALGVISGLPDANGIAGDLGGGSLELIHVANGGVHERATLPIGPVRLLGQEGLSDDDRRRSVSRQLKSVGWLKDRSGQNLYLVGGSWRALARLYMNHARAPIPILQGFVLNPTDAHRFCRTLASQHIASLKRIASLTPIPDRRIEVLPLAAEILGQLIRRMAPNNIVVSTLGLREGLLYNRLNHAVRRQDPFIAAATELARLTGRFPEHAGRIMDWTAPLFINESEDEKRLRYAACLLSDISWRGHPDFRAERAVYESLFGRFVGVGHGERALVGLALYDCYGGDQDGALRALCLSMLDENASWYAQVLGAALRLAQRISGGTLDPLTRTALKITPKTLTLEIDKVERDLFGEVAARRFSHLARLLGRNPEIKLRRSPA